MEKEQQFFKNIWLLSKIHRFILYFIFCLSKEIKTLGREHGSLTTFTYANELFLLSLSLLLIILNSTIKKTLIPRCVYFSHDTGARTLSQRLMQILKH